MMVGPLDGGSPAFGGNLWANPLRNILNANIVMTVVDRVPAMSDPEKEAVRAFTQTIQAFDFLKMITTRHVNAAPSPTVIDLTALPAPIATKSAEIANMV